MGGGRRRSEIKEGNVFFGLIVVTFKSLVLLKEEWDEMEEEEGDRLRIRVCVCVRMRR